MQCPKCGYILGDLETECLRCKRGGAAVSSPSPARVILSLAATPAEKECPRCGKATGSEAAACDKCGYEFQADSSRSERYQALLAAEARTAPPPSALRRTIPPALSWSLIGASLLAIGVAGWAMFGGMITGDDSLDSLNSAPIVALRHHKPRPGILHTVTYKITGTAPTAAIAYRGPDGTPVMPPGSVPLPWVLSFQSKAGTPLSVSAKPSGAAAVTVEIDVDGVLQKQGKVASAEGVTSASETL